MGPHCHLKMLPCEKVENEAITTETNEAVDGTEGVVDALINDGEANMKTEVEASEAANVVSNSIPPIPSAPPEVVANQEDNDQLMDVAEKSESLQLQESNVSAVTGDSSGDREDTDIATPTEYSIQEEKDSLNSEELKKYANNFGNDTVPDNGEIDEKNAPGSSQPGESQEEKVSTSEPTESMSSPEELLQVEVKPNNEAEIVESGEAPAEKPIESTQGNLQDEISPTELINPEGEISIVQAQDSLIPEAELPEAVSSPEPPYPVLKPDIEMETETENRNVESATPTTEMEPPSGTNDVETGGESKEPEIGESESEQTQGETVVEVPSQQNLETENEPQATEAMSDAQELGITSLDESVLLEETPLAEEASSGKTNDPEPQDSKGEPTLVGEQESKEEIAEVPFVTTKEDQPEEQALGEESLNIVEPSPETKETVEQAEFQSKESQSVVSEEMQEAEKTDSIPASDLAEKNFTPDESENTPSCLAQEPAQINNAAEIVTPSTNNETNGGGQVDEATPNAEKDKTTVGKSTFGSHEENPQVSEKPTVKPRLKPAKSVIGDLATVEVDKEDIRVSSPVLRRPKSGPGRSRTATSKYRSGFVMDNQISMEEMEKVIENEMQTKAASKIQAGFRGFKTRKSLNSKYGDRVSKEKKNSESSASVEYLFDAAVASCDEMSVPKKANLDHACSVENEIIVDNSTNNDLIGPLTAKPSLAPLRSHSIAVLTDDDPVDLKDPALVEAATKIQAVYRGFHVRNTIKRRLSDTQEVSDSKDLSPTLGNELLSPGESDIDRNESDNAATAIQTRFRSYKERKAFSEKKKAIILIQAAVRGYLTRKRLARARLRRESEAKPLEALSEYLDNGEKLHDAAIKIQAVYRGFKVRSRISQRNGKFTYDEESNVTEEQERANN